MASLCKNFFKNFKDFCMNIVFLRKKKNNKIKIHYFLKSKALVIGYSIRPKPKPTLNKNYKERKDTKKTSPYVNLRN